MSCESIKFLKRLGRRSAATPPRRPRPSPTVAPVGMRPERTRAPLRGSPREINAGARFGVPAASVEGHLFVKCDGGYPMALTYPEPSQAQFVTMGTNVGDFATGGREISFRTLRRLWAPSGRFLFHSRGDGRPEMAPPAASGVQGGATRLRHFCEPLSGVQPRTSPSGLRAPPVPRWRAAAAAGPGAGPGVRAARTGRRLARA